VRVDDARLPLAWSLKGGAASASWFVRTPC
jgi:hypothetical protein